MQTEFEKKAKSRVYEMTERITINIRQKKYRRNTNSKPWRGAFCSLIKLGSFAIKLEPNSRTMRFHTTNWICWTLYLQYFVGNCFIVVVLQRGHQDPISLSFSFPCGATWKSICECLIEIYMYIVARIAVVIGDVWKMLGVFTIVLCFLYNSMWNLHLIWRKLF